MTLDLSASVTARDFDLSMHVDPGEVVAVLGPNGAGTVSYTHLTLPTNREV